MSFLLSIDAGTTSIKAAVFNQEGQVLAIGREEYTLETPAPAAVELDVEVYWRACARVIQQAVADSRVRREEIVSVCISSQGETFVPIDSSGRPLRKALVWLDNRAVEQAALVEAHFGVDVIYQHTGQPNVAPTWPACKILWLRQIEPDIFKQAAQYLLLEDYLLFRLTGQIVTERAQQTSSLFLDLHTRTWWPEMLDFVGIRVDQLGRLMDPGEPVGFLTPAVANSLGLTPATLAVTGSMDQAIGAIGSGSILPRQVTENTGGALGIIYPVDRPIFDPQRRLPCYFHARAGQFVLLPWGQTAGMALRWFRDQFFAKEIHDARLAGRDPYALMTAEAAHIPPGCEGLVALPHLEGAFCPEFNANARAVFFGATLRHTRAHFTRSILESVAYMLKKNLDIVQQIGGIVLELRSTGGGARSPLWLQIKADVLQMPITTVKVEEASLLGAAILGAVTTGVYPNLETAVKQMVHVHDRIEPNPAQMSAYQAGYAAYLELYERLAPMFRAS
jgi:xylulokinase